MEPRIGMILYGYCEGYFGRDSYGPKRIEAIGNDWVVVREGDEPNFASFQDVDQDGMNELCIKWSQEKDLWSE